DGEVVVDLEDLQKELEQSMKEVNVELRESLRESRQALRHLRILDPRREYKASVGQGGARVQLSALNGAITLLAAGTKESEAKPLVTQRRSFTVTVPKIEVRVPNTVV